MNVYNKVIKAINIKERIREGTSSPILEKEWGIW